MQHKAKGRKLSRLKNQRRALLKTLMGSLILHEKIKTTEAKAKEVRPAIEAIIRLAKKVRSDEKKRVTVTRELLKKLPNKAVKKITGDFAGKFDSRTSGYARIIKLARRKSDGARMAVIEFV